MESDFITDAVFKYLENGEDLLAEAGKNATSRFVFQTAIMKQTYHKSGEAVKIASKAITLAETNKIGLLAVIDKVNVRLGVVGGIVTIASVLLFWLSRLP